MELQQDEGIEPRLVLQNELEIRAASLSLGALKDAIKTKRFKPEGGFFARLDAKLRVSELADEASSAFARNSLRGVIFDAESFGEQLDITGENDLALLQTASRILLAKEMNTLEFFNSHMRHQQTEEEYDEHHIYGHGFVTTVKKLNMIIDGKAAFINCREK